jgi:hypothetical protein
LAIYRIFKQRAFEPEAVICMARAYENTLVALRLSDRQDPITEIVAKKIVEIAENGERDYARLCERALEEIRGTGTSTSVAVLHGRRLDSEVKPTGGGEPSSTP